MEFIVKGIQEIRRKSENKDGLVVENQMFMTTFEAANCNKLILKSVDKPEFALGDSVEIVARQKQNTLGE